MISIIPNIPIILIIRSTTIMHVIIIIIAIAIVINSIAA